MRMETGNQNYVPGPTLEEGTFDKSKGPCVGVDTPFEENKVSLYNSENLLNDPKFDSSVDLGKLFEFEKGNINEVCDSASVEREEECVSCSSPEYQFGKKGETKSLENDPQVFDVNDKSACSFVKSEDEGYATCEDPKLEPSKELETAGKKDARSEYLAIMALYGYPEGYPADYSEDYKIYIDRHDKARELYASKYPRKGFVKALREQIRQAVGRYRMIRLIQYRASYFAHGDPEDVICHLEATHEAVEKEQAFIESHKKLLLFPEQGFSGDHLFYAALDSVLYEARRYRYDELFQWLHEYYGVEVPSKI